MSSNIEWVHCNKCLHLTKHEILKEHNCEDKDKYLDFVIWWNTKYTLFICCGCESVTLRRQYTCSEWESNQQEIEFYPPQVSRRLPQWQDKLPVEMQDLLAEVYIALHSNSRRLALMGARTVIDMFILDKIGDIGTFEEKLKKLVDGGYLGSKQRDILKVVLDAGSAAAHRGYNPSPEDLNHVIDVVESLLQFYIFEVQSNSVKVKIPPRARRTN
ncbi:hypothetical protein APA_3908 [Pseudanabaena sp. lw0831]|uniref:DUF4145 domain-containing protein n=1 Tax=Pseudanabaena sp. lw0831 TaxID=1357935 RepID=UPI0019162636|nr:DUF4145 domain-containing protein [Pseudanabaena sp. lw0831]GBO55758.1 hypothetical protein APA_3908 [Pseudanabaena sp. lw0831]